MDLKNLREYAVYGCKKEMKYFKLLALEDDEKHRELVGEDNWMSPYWKDVCRCENDLNELMRIQF